MITTPVCPIAWSGDVLAYDRGEGERERRVARIEIRRTDSVGVRLSVILGVDEPVVRKRVGCVE